MRFLVCVSVVATAAVMSCACEKKSVKEQVAAASSLGVGNAVKMEQQTGVPPESPGPINAYPMSLSFQKDMNPPVSVTGILR